MCIPKVLLHVHRELGNFPFQVQSLVLHWDAGLESTLGVVFSGDVQNCKEMSASQKSQIKSTGNCLDPSNPNLQKTFHCQEQKKMVIILVF